MRFALLSLIMISLSAFANAALIAYDGFESYSAGSELGGGSGGNDWSGNWQSTDPHVTSQGFILTDPTGNINGGSQSARLQPTVDLGDTASFMSRGFTATTGSDVYVSFLIRNAGGVDSGDFYNFQVSDGATGNSSSALGVGIRNANGNPFFARAGSSSNATTNSSTSAALDTTFLIVARFSMNGGSTYQRTDLYINPTGPSDPGTADATATFNTGLTQLSLLSVRNFSPEALDTLYIDELRVGTTFADVIPEPSAALLAAFGALGILLLMRRRC